MDISHLSRILERIAEVNRRYEEMARISGENFNIFNILHLSSKELIHSDFLAMLLDPTGIHSKGNIFIKLFLNILKTDFSDNLPLKDFPYENLRVSREFPTKYIHEYKKCGNIDIVITDKSSENRQIFIENKIYAQDQPKQLAVYHKANPAAIIIYLTLDGHDPDEDSTGEGMVKPINISYKDHIIRWLELCKKETSDHSFLRETLAQYIFLVKQLTGQARSKKMEQDIAKVIAENDETLSAFFYIVEFNRLELIKWIIDNKVIPKLKKIGYDDYGLELLSPPDKSEAIGEEFDKFASRGWGFYFHSKKWDKLDIVFIFEAGLRDFSYGFGYGYYDNKNPLELKELFQSCDADEYFLLKRMEKYSDWKSKEVLLELCKDDNDVIKTINGKIKDLLVILDNFKGDKIDF